MAKSYVEIIEQPAERSLRFRYESEGRNGGSILGVNSTRAHVTYPKIRVNNYTGPIAVYVSCVTNESKPRQHPHKLSKSGGVLDNGIYVQQFKVTDSVKEFEFSDIGIVFVKKENIQSALEKRREKNNDPTKGGWDHIKKPQFIDLHCVRLCFQVLGKIDSTDFNKSLGSAVSHKILDKKSHCSLNIVDLSSMMSQAQGGDKIMIFCDRVKREDISILFYEEEQTADGSKRTWNCELNHKNCKSMLIHHQYGIRFNTPSYKDPDIREARHTFIQLHRPSDNEYSKPMPFEFVPNDQMTKSILVNGKRRKCRKANETVAPFFAQIQNHQKKNDAKLKSLSKCMPNALANHLADNNRNNDAAQRVKVQQPVNEGQLIDFANDDGKENVCAPHPMPNEMYVNHAENWPVQMQYGHHPPDNMAQYPYARNTATHYPSSAQPSYANDRFNNLPNPQYSHNMHTPLIPTILYHHHHQYHQPQQLQQQQQQQQHPYTANPNANEYAADIQNTNPAMNHMPLAYNNNFNALPNEHMHATTNHNYNVADTNIDANMSNLNYSENLATTRISELFNPDDGNFETLSKEFKENFSIE